MSSQHGTEIKKPTPRRLFSLENLKSSDKRAGQPTTILEQLSEEEQHPWINSGDRAHLTSSPIQDTVPKDDTTHARWDYIRQHVLIAAGKPAASVSPPPQTVPPFHYKQPSSASSSASFPSHPASITSNTTSTSTSASVPVRPPSRSQTPKPGSRLAFAAKLGFKQVVDHAREAAVDENRKFAEDVVKACWAARSVDPLVVGSGHHGHGHGHASGKSKLGYGYGDSTVGSGTSVTGSARQLQLQLQMGLPFAKATMSSFASSVSGSGSGSGSGAGVGGAAASTVSLPGKRPEQQSGLGSPYTHTFNSTSGFTTASASTSHLASASGGVGQYTTPSIKHLHQILWQASGTSSSTLRSVYLPHESLVLSALLRPFTSSVTGGGDDISAKLEEERWLALDAFEVLVKTWPPANELASAERCLWCTKAITALPSSQLRSRILSALWGLTSPSENNHVFLSPDVIQSIASGVILLVPIVSPQQPQYQYQQSPPQQQSEPMGDAKILKEIVDHLAFGPLDEDALEDTYGGARRDDKKDEVEGVRRLMISEAAVCCAEVGVRELRVWLIRFGVEEYWYPLPSDPTPIQQTIAARRVAHFCTAALSILDLPPNEPDNNTRQSHAAAVARIVHLLEKVVIPEVDSLSNTGYRKDNKGKARDVRVGERGTTNAKRDWVWEARKGVTRVVVEVLCCIGMEDRLSVGMGVGGGGNVRWAVKLVARWYAAPPPESGSRSGREWREAFEEMLRDLVGDAEWATVANILMGVVDRLADGVCKNVVQLIFPELMDRLVQDPPPPALLSQPPSSRASSMYSSATPSPSPTPTQFHFHPYSNQQKPNLTTLLQSLSLLTPQTVFKPLFTLAASSREVVLANALCVVLALSAVVRDWWVRDAEMVGVALMSDVSVPSNRSGDGEKGTGMGQVLVMLELVRRLSGLRRVKDEAGGGGLVNELGGELARAGLVRFVVELEVRLAALIEVREKKAPIPLVQRMLFCMLFREFRLLTRSLKSAPWLPTVLRWVEEYFQARDECDDEIEGVVEEIRSLYELAKGNANSMHKRRTFAMMPTSYTPSSNADNKEEQRQQINIPEMLGAALKLVNGSLRKGFSLRAFKLLVTVSVMLSPVEWGRVAPSVWYHGLLLDGDSGGVMPLVCFLVMQCAEKNPLEFRAMVEVDMRSSDDSTRLASIHKISLLTNWRFQLMSESHNILVDRAHRPFRIARAPLPFVPTDIGSPNYVHDTDSDYTPYSSNKTRARVRGKSANARDAIPVELRRQLVEIGWVDDEGEADGKEVWIRTPVAMLPVALVERLDLQRMEGLHHHQAMSSPAQPTSTSSLGSAGAAQLTPLGASASPGAPGMVEGELLRRNSSSGGPTYAKRRAVFVPPLSLIFRVLATMVYDPNYAVAAAARDTLLDLMRNDPALLLRPILDLLCEEQGQEAAGNQKDVSEAVNVLTALLHTRHMLPPPMTHAVFNNLAGFLKYALRQTDSSFPSAVMRYHSGAGAEIDSAGTLSSFALTVPIMAQLARYVGELSIREIRRSKMEHFLIPYGTLWFGHVGVPGGPMFPKGLVDSEFGGKAREVNPFVRVKARAEEAVDPKLVGVVMIRIAQNMMFVDMLRKSAQDVMLVRKTMPRFVIPSLDGSEGMEDGGRLLELGDFVPFRKMKPESVDEENKAEKTLRVLSLALARSYVTLVAQVFRCMSRNSNDREEMANFVDGLNRILLVHGDDIGIVGHVLIAFMVASARFRRLFTSGGGYALFMPALVKIYAEFHQRIDIKLAIEYAVYRFYALHREAFLFQSVDAIAHISALPETNAAQYAARVYELFYSLRTGVAPTNLDPAGIHDINQLQEKEALLFHAAEDKPQTFLAAIRRGEAQTNGQIFFEVPDSYESSRLRMEDFIKLFLTIIAHDPSILRAQYFMRLFRFLAPHLYNASSQARNVLQGGVAALGEIQSRPFSKSKAAEASGAIRVGEADVTVPSGAEAPDKNKNASNPNIMRLDFLFALTNMAQAGSHMPIRMAQQALGIAELILKDAPSEMFEPLSTFFADLTKLVILRGGPSKPEHVIPFLQQMSPIIKAYTTILDFTSVLETITQVSSTLPFPNDPVFTRIVVHEVCAAGLEACELIASEAELSQIPFRTALVPLLAESVLLRGADVIGELEKRQPTFHFLTKVVLPLTLMLKTTDQLASESGKSEVWHRSSLARSWIRLLFYAMTACQRSFRASDNLPLSRSKSRDKRSGEEKQWQAHLPTFIAALQIIKVIVIRAEAEISTTLPDLWHRLAGFLRSVLTDGNAHFALRGSGVNDFSPSPSPSPSPRASAQLDKSGQLSFFDHLPGQLNIDTSSIIPSARPRAIDYALWSILEFLCAYRSPLRLQLRLFTVEKVVALDQELKTQQRHASPFASPNTSTASRRVSTSVFAKPRRSGMFPSPDSSPRASRSPSMINELSIPSLHLSPGANSLQGRLTSLEIPHSTSGGELRIPGYQYISPTLSPSTPRRGAYIQVEGEENQGPRIVHLGPTSPSALIPPPPLSPSGGGTMGVNNIRLMAQSTKIKSSVLIRTTYRRIRTVQTFMGYDTLLPMLALNAGLGITGVGLESDEISFVTWTKRSALEAVLNEMTHLEEEFEDVVKGIADGSGRLGGDDSAFVETVPALPNNLDGAINV